MTPSRNDTIPFSGRDRSDQLRLALVVGVAIVLRLAYFYFNSRRNPAFAHPILDSLYHHDWARGILAGDWGNEVYFRGPLYPYLLAFLYKISGTSIAFAAGVQHAIGALVCGLVYVLARESFSRGVSLTAGLGAALYWVFVFFEGELLIVTVFMFLVMAALLFLARTLRRPTVVRLALTGLLLGLAALARPSIIAFYPAVPVLLMLRRGEGISWPRASAIVFVAASIAIAPAMIRNYVVADEVVPIASSGGVNFYIGNNPESDGRTAIVPGTGAPWMGGNEEAIDLASKTVGRRLTPAQTSSHYFRRGLHFVSTHPGAAFVLWLKKIGLFWEGAERSNEKFIYFFWHLSPTARLPLIGFWMLGPLALMGLFMMWPRRRELSLLYLFVGLYMLGVVTFFVNARLRLPVVPVLLIFAAAGLGRLVWLVRHRNFKGLVIPLVVLIVSSVAVNASYPAFSNDKPTHYAISYYTLASGLLQGGDKDGAIEYYRQAADAFAANPSPNYAYIARDIHTKLGGLYFERGMCEEVVDVFSRVQGDDEMALYVRGVMATCLERLHRFDDAIAAYRTILAVRPGDGLILQRIARCHDQMGRPEEAAKIRERLQTPSREAQP